MKKLIEWVDIPTTDINRAVDFYNHVLSLQISIVDCGNEMMAFFSTGEGSLYYSSDSKPSINGAIISFNVPDSIEDTLKRALEKGAKVIIGKTKIEAQGRGYFANIIDSEGNRVGLYED